MPVDHFSAFSKQRRYDRGAGVLCACCHSFPRRLWAGAGRARAVATATAISAPTPTRGTPSVKSEVPQEILDPVLKEAAALAEVARDQLVIVHAESVVWNDGSLGCPEPGMMYTQTLVNGYWILIEAAARSTTSASAAEAASDCARQRRVMRHYRRTPTKASVPIRQESRRRPSNAS